MEVSSPVNQTQGIRANAVTSPKNYASFTEQTSGYTKAPLQQNQNQVNDNKYSSPSRGVRITGDVNKPSQENGFAYGSRLY